MPDRRDSALVAPSIRDLGATLPPPVVTLRHSQCTPGTRFGHFRRRRVARFAACPAPSGNPSVTRSSRSPRSCRLHASPTCSARVSRSLARVGVSGLAAHSQAAAPAHSEKTPWQLGTARRVGSAIFVKIFGAQPLPSRNLDLERDILGPRGVPSASSLAIFDEEAAQCPTQLRSGWIPDFQCGKWHLVCVGVERVL